MEIKEFKIMLDEKILEANEIFITPHIRADYDALASAIAMVLIVRKLGKDACIVIDDDSIDFGIKTFLDEIKDSIKVISSEKCHKMLSDNSLLIAVDMNKKYLTSCRMFLDEFKNFVIIDHHKPDEQTIATDCKFIDSNVSSASEILTELLCLYGIKYTPRIADYLLAGIYLDTNKFSKNASPKTMENVFRLTKRGGDLSRVNVFFEVDFEADRKVQSLVDQASFLGYKVAIALSNGEKTYNREELAKAADYLLKCRDVDGAFVIGLTSDESIAMSARSKGYLDVSEIMQEFGGGGHIFSAAAQVHDETIIDVKEKLERVLVPKFYNRKNK